jgi:protein phosphatase
MLTVSEHFAKTDTGRQRRSNEDSYYASPPLFAVADGMGGARAGEVASRILVETLESGLGDVGADEQRLAERVREANQRIHDLALRDSERAGMGTTATAAYVGEDGVAVAHVGDSRAYRWRGGELEQVTRDHSLVEELRRRGKLTAEEAEDHPQRSVITRALGPEAAVDVDTVTVPAQAGDAFLLCSDGLTGMVPEDRIGELLGEAKTLEEAGRRLIREANDRGGRDNITVVLFRVDEVDAPREAADGATRVRMTAPTPEQVEAAKAEAAAAGRAPAQRETPAPVGSDSAAAPSRPRRTMPLPPRERPAPAPAPRRRRQRVPGLGPALVVLAILAVVVGGTWAATRAVYFVGIDDGGFVTVYRGLPYELPAGLDLYERWYRSGVPVAELPPRRRRTLLDHRLRSRADASDLVRKLELGQVRR